MAKKSAIAKQKHREEKVRNSWEKRQRLKKLAIDFSLSEEEREEARRQLNKMSPNTSAVRLRNRCQLTGRPRGNYKKFKISRLCFRELASDGRIPGLFKASW